MERDIITEKFFELERWKDALETGVAKDIDQAQLYRLAQPETRAAMYGAIREERYRIAPPHTAKIPKDNGEFRTVYVNEPIDRIFLSIANNLLFELCPEMIHPSCKSYQKGIGCGRIVQKISARISSAGGDVIGWKSDLSKYFDSVPIRYIDEAFDRVEDKYGESAVIKVLRNYYHSDWYFEPDGALCCSYQSLKQGCAVASWLANVLLYHIDEALSGMDGDYVRYSDDMLFVGPDYPRAMETLKSELRKMEMKLNPKKVEYLGAGRWFKFLGFSIRGADISLSGTRIKSFQREIEARTVKLKDVTPGHAIRSVCRYLYEGIDGHSWATQVLPIVNVKHDVDLLNAFVMDCLRAVHTGKKKIGGLGYAATGKQGCVQRGKGRNVTANLRKVPGNLEGYMSLWCARDALKISRELYTTLVRAL